jgi:protein tyrosine phosphatase
MDLVKTLFSALEAKPNNPALFHCSAGVGRTGTFLMVFSMYQLFLKLKKQGKLNEISVFDEIMRLRGQRKFFAETKDQYKFIYSFLKLFNKQE